MQTFFGVSDGDMLDVHDALLKKLMMKKTILAGMAVHVIEEFKGMDPAEVVQYFEDPMTGSINAGDRESTNETGTVRYDILVRLRSPKGKGKRLCVLFNIEGQFSMYPKRWMKNRMVYYGCRLVADQKGTIFQGDAYQNMVKVVSVWINLHPPLKDQGKIIRWPLCDVPRDGTERPKPLNSLEIWVVCVPDAEHVPLHYHDIAGMLGVYLSKAIGLKEKQRLLKGHWNIDLPEEEEKDLKMFEGAGAYFRKECIAQGRIQGIAEGRAEGRIQGIAEGKAEGRIQGKAEERSMNEKRRVQEIISVSKSLHVPYSQAMDIMGFTKEEHSHYLKLLAKKETIT